MNEANKTMVWATLNGSVVATGSCEDFDVWAGKHGDAMLDWSGADAAWLTDMREAPVTWCRHTRKSIGGRDWHEVPVEVREACALWLPGWAGRHCAEEWHRESPGEVEEGATFDRWRMDQNLPAQGDVDYLRDCTWRLLGREPSETERRAFGEALLERLFDLTPVASDGGEVAA